jgi:hypothetical protein
MPVLSRALRIILLIACVPATALAQATYTITSTAASGPGSLPAAIAAMQSNGSTQTLRFQLPAGSTIVVGADLPSLTGTQVEVLGTDTPGLMIDGGGFALFRYSGQSLLMRDITLRNGRGARAGCLASNATLSTQVFDSRFIDCRTDGSAASGSAGGALFAFGPLRLTRTRFEGNAAYDGGIDNLSLGGGAVSSSGSSLLIENSAFVGNLTVRTVRPAGGCFDAVGGALAASIDAGGSALLSGVEFSANAHRCGTPTGAYSGQGGAVSIFGPSSGALPQFSVDSSFFGGNRSANGGAIFARAVALNISNASFHDNDGGGGAGSVFLTTGFGTPPTPELRLQSSTFWRNRTASASFGADLTLNAAVLVRQFRNVLFAAPLGGNSCAPAFFNADAGAAVFTTDLTCFASVGGTTVTAQFAAGSSFGLQAPAAIGGVAPGMDLAADSVAIDNGSNVACPPRDARGVTRPYDGNADGGAECDVGATEYRPDLLLRNGFE